MSNPIAETHLAIKGALAGPLVGHADLVDFLVVALLCEGHVLIEGVPGTAKTLLVRSLARVLDCQFNRVQFTADLMPSDVTGVSIFRPQEGEFRFRPGPLFTHLLLGDEINRAPAKTQSALLQAMEERQVTVDGISHDLPPIFLVVATQNPVEQEGTYPLPEAQLDRFMFKLLMGYPSEEEEVRILAVHHSGSASRSLDRFALSPVVDVTALLAIRSSIQAIHVEEPLLRYATRLVRETRQDPRLIRGASPRAGLQMVLAGKGFAALQGRDFVLPDDIKKVLLPTLRHRIEVSPGAELEGVTPDDVLMGIRTRVEVPR